MMRCAALLSATAVALTVSWSGAAMAEQRECRAAPELLDLGHALDVARVAVVERKELRVVAMGSSSTQGYGASNPRFAYPVILKSRLEKLLPGVAVHVFNKGIGGQDAEEETARMKEDVGPEKAQLVIWQVARQIQESPARRNRYRQEARCRIHSDESAICAGRGRAAR
jgi:acyl-CoA thioesterase I